MDYLSRYQNGEQVAVWQELIALGPAIREEPLYSQAEAVARKTMRRVKHNVESLIERLKTLDYKFVQEPLIALTPENINDLHRLEQETGFIPLSLRIFYEEVGQINLMGSHPKLNRYRDRDYKKIAGFDVYPDPIVVECDVIDYIDNLLEDIRNTPSASQTLSHEDNKPWELARYSFTIAQDFYSKANESSNNPLEIFAPNGAIDAKIFEDNLGERNYCGYFVAYLRECFRWGGFPGWKRSKHPPMAEIHFLKKDLLPI